MEKSLDEDAKGKTGTEKEMQRMWEEAAKEFEQICGESIMIGDIKSFEDVEQRIRTAEENSGTDQEQGQESTKAKELGLKSLDMLKVLVGVAKMASDVLPIPPWATNIAGNALCKVFDIGRNLENYSNAINGVFDEVSSLLSQFRIYEDISKRHELPDSLLRQIQKVLIRVVRVCAHVVKYRQGKKQYTWKQNLKAAFGSDSGLKTAMDEVRELSRQQVDLEGTVTLSYALETNRSIMLLLRDHSHYAKLTEEIHDGVQFIYDHRMRAKKLLQIRDWLRVSHVLDSNTTPECTRIDNQCLEDTGEWIWDLDAFKNWSNPSETNAPHVLLISGAASSGKTCASAKITKRLEGLGTTRRAYVANYFFAPLESDTFGKQSTQTDTLSFAIKNMAFQIARVDPTVREALSKVRDEISQQDGHSTKDLSCSGPTELENLWSRMAIGNTAGAAHFLVFDGINCLSEDQQKSFFEFLFSSTVTGGAGRVRVLLSGLDVDKLAEHNQTFGIKMEDHNGPDVKIFIKNVMDREQMLRSAKPGSVQEKAREAIIEKLPLRVKGRYSLLSFALQKVMEMLKRHTDLEELNTMLEGSMIEPEMVVRHLEKSLRPNEIKDLNELLKWVIYSPETMSLDELESVWLLQSSRKPIASLEEIIKSTYGAIFVLSDSGHITTAEGTESYLKERNKSLHESSDKKDQPTISMTITINQADKQVCGHFLWDVARHVSGDQFKFDNTSLTSNNQATIAVDDIEAHNHIIVKSLDYLLDKSTGKSNDIGKYLVRSLPHHLQCLKAIDDKGDRRVPDDQLVAIAKKLHTLFKDGEVLGHHKNSFAGTWWTAGQLPIFTKWCLALDVRWPPKSMDAAWVKKMKEAPSLMEGFLDEWTKTMVKAFVMGRDWRVLHAWWWIEEFLAADEINLDSFTTPSTDGANTQSLSSSRRDTDTYWRQVGAWCQRILGLSDSKLTSLWYERLAQIARHYSYRESDAVTSLLRSAVELPDPSWTCYRDMANAYHAERKYEEAIHTAQEALNRFMEGNEKSRPPIRELLQFRLTLADWTYAAKAVNEAREHYAFVAASQDANSQQVKLSMVGNLKAALSLSDAEEFEQILTRLVGKKSKATMSQVLHLFALDEDHDSFMSRLFGLNEHNPPLLQSIVNELEVATVENDAHQSPLVDANNDSLRANGAKGVLLNDRAIAAYFYQMLPKRLHFRLKDPTTEAISLWEECLDNLSVVKGFNDYMAKNNAMSALANHYFQRGMEDTEGREIYASQLWNLAYQRASLDGDALAFLGALYAPIDRERSRFYLRQKLRHGLRLLFDDTPDNDRNGFNLVVRAHLLSNDFRNAAAAVSLRNHGDFVTEAVAISFWDGKNDLDNPTAQDLANEIGKRTIEISRRLPGPEKQSERIKAALEALSEVTEHVTFQSLSSVIMDNGSWRKGETSDMHDPELSGSLLSLTAWTTKLQTQLEAASQRAMRFDEATERYCDGHRTGGKECQKHHNFATPFFNCIYCWDKDFCKSCLDRLLNPNAKVKVTVCNANHKWLKLPPLGDDICLGATAKTIRLNRNIKPTQEDDRILEITYEKDWDEPEMTVEDWKESLAINWGFSMNEIRT